MNTEASDPVLGGSSAETPATPTQPTGPFRATISGGYRIRLLILTLGLCGFACWALYDGYYAYPKKQAMYEDLEAFKELHDDWQTQWQGHARAKGYPDDIAKNPTKLKPLDKYDIATQYGMAAVCMPVGLYFAYGWFAAGRRFVEADEQGVRTHNGVDLTWEQIQELESGRWKSKGIAYLKYQDPNGKEARVLLDDWKFERDPTTAIYQLAQAKLGHDQPEAQTQTQAETPQP